MLRSRIGKIVRLAALCIALLGTFGRIFLSLRGEMGPSVLLYFTVQSNLMVCLFLGMEVSGRRVSRRPAVQGGVLMYIIITGLVYNILLASTWSPRGLNLLITTINHTITPLLFLLDWLLSQDFGSYKGVHLLYWLIYPVLYALFGSIEGAVTGEFRYFFMDFINQSPAQYALMMLLVTAVFLFIGLIILKFNHLNLDRKEAEYGKAD
ncbi:MAG: Pr6Pr family membrane protein [Spirochaetales bacterium]|nr:Pr6Pr family membrane protein [Spirochaetales bacterium]